MADRRGTGKAGEDAAVDYLTKKGYHILARNYRFDRSEIDIIAEQQDELVFVEVKARRLGSPWTPEEGLTPTKCRHIKKVAQGYCYELRIEDRACRFDLVAVEYDGTTQCIRHIEDAF